jgi:hypothetical protein
MIRLSGKPEPHEGLIASRTQIRLRSRSKAVEKFLHLLKVGRVLGVKRFARSLIFIVSRRGNESRHKGQGMKTAGKMISFLPALTCLSFAEFLLHL